MAERSWKSEHLESVAAPATPDGVVVRTHPSMEELGRSRWLSLCDEAVPPHLRFEWLDALERSGAATVERGWMPTHLSVESGGRLIAVAPAYLRGDSSGEFVFDQSWADFAETHLNLRYYPKLVVAVPFTPATGPRVLVAEHGERGAAVWAVASGLRELTTRMELSGAHVLFPPREDAEQLVRLGWHERHTIQFHWHNEGYRCFDDFLEGFTAKRRHQIRRERRLVHERGIEVEVLTGAALHPALAAVAHDLYLTTVDKFFYGRRYLNREFFELVFETMPEQLMLVLARDRLGHVLAGALNLVGQDALYGRYWGAKQEIPFLHFECCYYRGIEEAIRLGKLRFEPGAGGEHKLSRGFAPTVLQSLHHLTDPRLSRAVASFLTEERRAIAEHASVAAQHTGRH